MPYRLIDPQEKLDYSCDWSTFLDEGGSPSDTLSSSAWEISPQSGSPTEPALTGAQTVGNVTSVFVNGGVAGEMYRLTNRVETAQGRTADRSWILRCEHR